MIVGLYALTLITVTAMDAGTDGGLPANDEAPRIELDLRWSQERNVAIGPAEVIGLPSAGCLRGAAILPRRSKNYVLVRPERRRFYGHPSLIAYLRNLSDDYKRARLGSLHIGDLGQPKGGPTPTGHRSHQNGLDVDLWFAPVKKPSDPPPVMVDLKTKRLTSAWGKKVIERIRLAALSPEVDRIFVHPAIKRALCIEKKKNRAWLARIRPWKGHHDHLHVRLRCPPDSPLCQNGRPIPEGDGCDRSLDWWFIDEKKVAEPRKESPPETRSPMPTQCFELLVR